MTLLQYWKRLHCVNIKDIIVLYRINDASWLLRTLRLPCSAFLQHDSISGSRITKLRSNPLRHCRTQGYYSLVVDAFTLLDIDGTNNCEMKHWVPNATVEITRSCQLTLEWDEMFARCYIINQIQVRRTVLLRSRGEYNAYTKITRRIKCISETYWIQQSEPIYIKE